MLTKNIKFRNFGLNKFNKKIKNFFEKLIKEDNEILNSLKITYKDKYSKKEYQNLKIFLNF